AVSVHVSVPFFIYILLLYAHVDLRDLPSFPTRRSSDLDIIVVLPAKAGEKRFKYEQKVKLVNPKITAEGKNVRGRGYTNYILNRSEEHTSELQSRFDLVCRLLLEKKKK